MQRRIVLIASVALTLTAMMGNRATAQQILTYPDLVHRMIDLEHLATLPPKGETVKQWASWDRGSQYDALAEKYVNWAANGDGNGLIRKEGDREVMAEMEGPGCLWRVWSALPEKGHVKIYLDGSDTPVIDMPFADWFDGKHAPFDYPLLSYRLEDLGCRGQNLYFPIPYRKSCKIVAEGGWGRYYHFNYTTFAKGTTVPVFTGQLSTEDAAALRRVNDYFAADQGTDPAAARDGEKTHTEHVQIGAGETIVMELPGPRAITAIRGRMKTADRDDEMAALRRLVLRITWDDQRRPAVWCPAGDFFGTAPGKNLYKSLPTGITEDGGYSLWYMPFAKRAKLELVNFDTKDRQLEVEIVTAPLARPMEELGYFHCKWHRDVFPLTEDRWPDWTMIRAEGRGRFCGVMLHVFNAPGGWWGEGDEKFFVDGEKYPSTFGTGSEDYFGYAWGHPGLFERPYHCQTMTQNNRGHQSLIRWHISDAVPYQKSFEGCIEKYFPNDRGTLFACTACWYLAAGGTDPHTAVAADGLDGYYQMPPLTAGGLRVLGHPKGEVKTQPMEHFSKGTWKDNDHLWWTGGKPGDKLDIVLPVKKTGPYLLSVVLTKARDYGIVQFHVDDKKVGEPVDLYNPDVINTDPIPLGAHHLEAGDHKLTVEITGANPEAVKAYMFGLDVVTLNLERQ